MVFVEDAVAFNLLVEAEGSPFGGIASIAGTAAAGVEVGPRGRGDGGRRSRKVLGDRVVVASTAAAAVENAGGGGRSALGDSETHCDGGCGCLWWWFVL